MELRLLQRLVRLMQKGEITDLEVDDSQAGLRIRLRRGPEAPTQGAPVVHVTQGAAAPAPIAIAAAPAAEAPAAAAPASQAAAATPFVSPMVGTYYRAASPDAEPFVTIGSIVKAETVLCIIEAMKVMNEIKAEMAGEVVEVLVENGEPVEFGQPLFLIRTS